MSLQCPYCENYIDDPEDRYEQDVSYEEECPHCKKNFVFKVEYERNYWANKADCLNGGSHRYVERNSYGIHGEKTVKLRCQDCGNETKQPLKE